MRLKISYTAIYHGRPVVNVQWNPFKAAIAMHCAWLAIHAVNYVAKLFLFVPIEEHVINLVQPN